MIFARIASALVLAPLALVLVWLGHPLLSIATAVVGTIMVWEWEYLVGGGRHVPWMAVTFLSAAIAILLGGSGMLEWALAIAIVGSAIRVLADRTGRPVSAWTAAGFAWILAGCLGFLWLRGQPDGRAEAYWLLLLVWSVDTGAFVAGKTIGGPRLVQRISPNKTWAGLAGGVVAGAVVGAIAAASSRPDGAWLRVGIASAALAIVEQMGDIAESYAKRRFGVKDSGSLIPGHGGVLDRLDGMLAVVVAVVLLNLVGVKVW